MLQVFSLTFIGLVVSVVVYLVLGWVLVGVLAAYPNSARGINRAFERFYQYLTIAIKSLAVASGVLLLCLIVARLT